MISEAEYLADIPNLHTWDGGETWNSGGFFEPDLSALIRLVRDCGPGAEVVETGAGNSTVSFLLAGAGRVQAICPDQDLFDRIAAYCDAQGIDRSGLTPIVGWSEDVLPKLADRMEAEGRRADLVLIDGGHGWPTVFVDFCYMFRILRPGGYLVIDDIQIHGIKELARMLVEDPRVERVETLRKTLIFRKTADVRYLPDWYDQPYIFRRTDAHDTAL